MIEIVGFVALVLLLFAIIIVQSHKKSAKKKVSPAYESKRNDVTKPLSYEKVVHEPDSKVPPTEAEAIEALRAFIQLKVDGGFDSRDEIVESAKDIAGDEYNNLDLSTQIICLGSRIK